MREQPGRAGAQRERAGDDGLLHPAVPPGWQQRDRVLRRVQGRLPRREIDWAPVVGIDQAEIPELGSLIQVRNAGAGEPQQRLRQAVDRARRGDPRGEARKFPGHVHAAPGVEQAR